MKLRILYYVSFAFMVLGMWGAIPVTIIVAGITHNLKVTLVITILGIISVLLGFLLLFLYEALINDSKE